MPSIQTQTDGRRTGVSSGARQRRVIGRSKKTSKVLKKTTKKGAYNKTRKKNFQIRRAPFVETKFQTDVMVSLKSGNMTGDPEDTIRRTTEPLEIEYKNSAGNPKELTIFPLQSFMNMNQGFDQSEMVGNQIYSRYLKCKLEFQLPYGGNQIRHPCDMFLIHGWVTQKIGNTMHTVPDALNFTRSDYNEHIEEQILQYFNQRSDKLEFIPKKTSNLKILGYRKLKVKKSSNLGPDPNTISTATQITNAGAHPVINMVCSWPMKRKLHYELGTAGSTPTPLQFYYPNYCWLPFVALFNPTANEFLSTVTYPGDGPATNNPPKMYVRYNSIHYFSDS